MNIKRPSESWEILSDGLWFSWKEHFLKTACVRTARVRFDADYGLFSCMYLEDTVNEFLLNIYVMIRHLLHNSIVPGTVLI